MKSVVRLSRSTCNPGAMQVNNLLRARHLRRQRGTARGAPHPARTPATRPPPRAASAPAPPDPPGARRPLRPHGGSLRRFRRAGQSEACLPRHPLVLPAAPGCAPARQAPLCARDAASGLLTLLKSTCGRLVSEIFSCELAWALPERMSSSALPASAAAESAMVRATTATTC